MVFLATKQSVVRLIMF